MHPFSSKFDKNSNFGFCAMLMKIGAFCTTLLYIKTASNFTSIAQKLTVFLTLKGKVP